MKEVKDGRVAGPFDEIPFRDFIQSPIGLVPKAGGKTRMIFHLSYDFKTNSGRRVQSLNTGTPKHLCHIKYNDLDVAVRQCLHLVKEFCQEFGDETEVPVVFLGKTDLSSAFRVLPLKIRCLCWLVFKAIDPCDG